MPLAESYVAATLVPSTYRLGVVPAGTVPTLMPGVVSSVVAAVLVVL